MEKRLISELEKGKYKTSEKHFIMSKSKKMPLLPPKKAKRRKGGRQGERREVGFVKRIQEPI